MAPLLHLICPHRHTPVRLAFVLAIASVVASLTCATAALAQGVIAPPASLKTVAVPRPANLAEFVRDEQAAVALGKAFFWDMQAGSDGVVACASCHFHAGADNRLTNQVNPGTLHGATAFELRGPNTTLTAADFPLHELADPLNRFSPVLFDTDDVVSSQGVFRADFLDVVGGSAEDACTSVPDPVWNVAGTNVRRVEPRNAPTVINAVFTFRNFWDGRASAVFNGVNPFGPRDPNARVLAVGADGKVAPVAISVAPASLASQAVGPPLSGTEMSCDGRTFPKLGKKLFSLTPLGKQQVSATDSVLGPLARSAAVPSAPGLAVSYAQLVAQAFQPKWWDSSEVVTFTGGVPVLAAPTGAPLTTSQFTVMEANFSLFWGLAINLYEATLVSDDAPFDRFREGDASALTALQQQGMQLFLDTTAVRCINHHRGSLFTGAIHPQINGEEPIQLMDMPAGLANYDGGFYNIGVRPNAEDLAVGGEAPAGQPLSFARRVQRGLGVADLAGVLDPAPIAPSDLVVADGAVKTPNLRNVELTAPYMRNGGFLTLEQVVEFYARRGDFGEANMPHFDPDLFEMTGLTTAPDRAAVVAFMRSLTDDRVRFEEKPFDHPQLLVTNGHVGDETGVVGDGSGKALDVLLEVPAVGAAGRCVGIDGTSRPCCGDGLVNRPSERCDGSADAVCPGQCLPECVCAGDPIAVELSPIADTYIEAGVEGTWDHGASDHMDVDRKPLGISYLKFDLRGIAGTVRAATLTLFCTNASEDGGTVYPVADSSWVEGTASGLDATSVGRPGLTFVQIDSNADGQVSAADTSPYVPDLARPLGAIGAVIARQASSVDVSAAFAGPGIYTLAVKSNSTNGATYSSRNDGRPARRPLLRLLVERPTAITTSATGLTPTRTPTPIATAIATVVGATTATPLPTTTRTITPTRTPTPIATATPTRTPTRTTTAAATSSPTATPSAAGTPGLPATLVLTPIADTYIEAGTQAPWDHGASDHLDVDLSPRGITYLKFDLRGIAGTVTSAQLVLWCSNASADGGTVYPVADSTWIEGDRTGGSAISAQGTGLKWTDVDTNLDGAVDGADTSPYVPATASPVVALGPVALASVVTANVTAAFQGGPRLYSLAIANRSTNGATFSSRQNTVVAHRPQLHLAIAPLP